MSDPQSRLRDFIENPINSRASYTQNQIMSDIDWLLDQLDATVEAGDKLRDQLEKTQPSNIHADDLIQVVIIRGTREEWDKPANEGIFIEHRMALIAPIRAFAQSPALRQTLSNAFELTVDDTIKSGMQNG